MRASLGRPYFFQLLRELPELKLWCLVYLWWALSLCVLLFSPSLAVGFGIVLSVLTGVIALMSFRKGGFSMGLYTVVAWFFHAAALPVGFFRRRRKPDAPIESKLVGAVA
ncbi:hypothetical protein D9M72_609000 [compost metagenome]